MPCPHNNIECPCPKENCPRHGKYCEGVAHHKAHGKKPPTINMPWSESKQIRHQTTKYIDWKYEQEIRAIKQFDKEDISKEERVWHINKNAIVGLYLGARMKPWKSNVIKKILEENNFNISLALMQISKDTMDYKLVPWYLR